MTLTAPKLLFLHNLLRPMCHWCATYSPTATYSLRSSEEPFRDLIHRLVVVFAWKQMPVAIHGHLQ